MVDTDENFGQMANRLLVLDDQKEFAEVIATIAKDLGYAAQCVVDFDEFRRMLVAFNATHIVLDLNMPGTDGVEVMRFLESVQCTAKIILVSGFDRQVLNTAAQLGRERNLSIVGVFEKPFGLSRFREALLAAKQRATASVADLELAIEQNQIRPYFQPKALLGDDSIWQLDSFEILARWQHPKFGIIMPGEFISVAERHGLISSLTDSIFNAALSESAETLKRYPYLSIAINISRNSLSDMGLPDRLAKCAARWGINASQVTLELTESGTVDDAKNVMDILTRLRLKHFLLSLDDFGTGFSSLIQLYRLPFSELKIDRSFVTELESSDEARVIVEILVQLGQKLKLTTCAEGVETESTLQRLSSLGCNKAQGFLFSPALPFAEVWNAVTDKSKGKWHVRDSAKPNSADILGFARKENGQF